MKNTFKYFAILIACVALPAMAGWNPKIIKLESKSKTVEGATFSDTTTVAFPDTVVFKTDMEAVDGLYEKIELQVYLDGPSGYLYFDEDVTAAASATVDWDMSVEDPELMGMIVGLKPVAGVYTAIAKVYYMDGENRVYSRIQSSCTVRGVSVEFSAADEGESGNAYGYDDMDTEDKTDDDQICVKKGDKTFVNTKVIGLEDASEIYFQPITRTAATATKPAETPGSGFLLQINGGNVDKGNTSVLARLSTASGPVVGRINVHVYKQRVLQNIGVYRVVDSTSSGTSPVPTVSTPDLNTYAARVLKNAVLDTNYSVTGTPSNYDINKNGTLDWYYDNGSQPEFDIIQDTIEALTSDPAVVVVKDVAFAWRLASAAKAGDSEITLIGNRGNYLDGFSGDFYLNDDWVRIVSVDGNTVTLKVFDFDTADWGPLKQDYPAGSVLAYPDGGGVSTQPAIVEAGNTNSTILHECLHWNMFGDLLDIEDVTCIMNYFGSVGTDIRYFPRPKHYHDGDENQWDKVPRN